MKLDQLRDLYVAELRDLFDAENQILKALPKMAKAAASPDLQDAFQDHLDETEDHLARLEEVLDELGEKPKGRTCKAIAGLIEEASEWMRADALPEVRDAALIAAAQRIEHYEIAVYGCVRTYAEQLGREDDADLLQQTLDEEKDTDERLSDLAIDCINLEAEETEEA